MEKCGGNLCHRHCTLFLSIASMPIGGGCLGGEGIGISNWMGCLKRGVASIFKRMECFGAAFAEWFHPEKQLGLALARDNLCSLSRKLPSLTITTSRYRENYPRSR